MYFNPVKIFAVIVLMMTQTICVSADLIAVYRLAEKNDPTYLQEIASHRAALETRPQALSQLLPNINLEANTTRIDQSISSAQNFGRQGDVDFNNRGYSLKLSQPLYRRDRLIALEQADSQIKQAATRLTQAHQNLMFRIAERYFDVLSNLDNLEFAKAEVKSLERQLEQARQRFEVGLTAITDVQEAQAGYDLAIAEEILARNAIDNAQEAMRELTGHDITQFNPLTETILLARPDPETIEHWAQLSLQQNLNVIAANHAKTEARQEIERQSASHYPTLDLVASQDYNSSGGRFGSNKTHSTNIGLNLNIPIYSGGFASSKVRQANEDYNIAVFNLESARRTAERLSREAYLGVLSGISRVNALGQAVVSSETALTAAEAGFEVGTRTAVDVVTSQRSTSEARRNYSQAKYNYIIDTIRLKLAVGSLSPTDLAAINTWLTSKIKP